MAVSFSDIMKELKNGKFRPIYLLMGEETYLIDQIVKFIENNALPESQRIMNQIVIYGKETNATDVIQTAQRYPIMSEKLVVIVKDADEMKNFEKMAIYAKKPLKHTILVLVVRGSKLKSNSEIVKEIQNNGLVFEAKKIYENKLPNWIDEFVTERGYKIDHLANKILVENIGADLEKIANELEKIFISLPPNSIITAEVIEESVGISREFNVFELQKAILQKNYSRALMIADYLTSRENYGTLPMIVSSLFNFFTKILVVHTLENKSPQNLAAVLNINQFFVNDYIVGARNYSIAKIFKIIDILKEYDKKAKGIDNYSATDNDLVKEMIFKIIH